MDIQKEPSLIDKVNQLYESAQTTGKVKKLNIIRKAKVKKRKLKKGWVGIIRIDENGCAMGEKQQIEGSTIRLKDGTYHAIDRDEIILWKGKFPVVIQPTWKRNPLKLFKEGELNETASQKYIMARMLKDVIIQKNKGGKIIVYILIVGVIIFAGLKIFKVI